MAAKKGYQPNQGQSQPSIATQDNKNKNTFRLLNVALAMLLFFHPPTTTLSNQ
jgi:hypothetical protein